MKTIILFISLAFLCPKVSAQDKKAKFIGGESMLDVYLKKKLSEEFEDIRLVFELQVNREGRAHSPHIISPKDNIALQAQLEEVVAQMPKWTPAYTNGCAVSTVVNIESYLESSVCLDFDHAPFYPNGTNEWFRFLKENLRNPHPGQKEKVTIKFVVDKNGKIRYPEIWQGGKEEYDNEAMRVFSLVPEFKPAEKNGEKVKSNYAVTFYFY